jgi:hypothetical protein
MFSEAAAKAPVAAPRAPRGPQRKPATTGPARPTASRLH